DWPLPAKLDPEDGTQLSTGQQVAVRDARGTLPTRLAADQGRAARLGREDASARSVHWRLQCLPSRSQLVHSVARDGAARRDVLARAAAARGTSTHADVLRPTGQRHYPLPRDFVSAAAALHVASGA